MEAKESLRRLYEQLSDGQKQQFRNCKTMEEVIRLANKEEFELSEEQLDFLSGGGCPIPCPYDPNCKHFMW